jgi:hypothetical protein
MTNPDWNDLTGVEKASVVFYSTLIALAVVFLIGSVTAVALA